MQSEGTRARTGRVKVVRRLGALLSVAACGLAALPGAAAAQQQAPALSVDGQTIRWQQVGSVTRYLLATKRPGASTAYSYVTCTTAPRCAHTPPARAGETVTYGMRTDVRGSAWAREVQITYPGTSPGTGTGAPVRTLFGTSSLGGDAALDSSRSLGAKARRMYDVHPRTSAASLRERVGAIADRGMQPVMLANWSSMPTDAEAANLATWAREFGPGGTFWQSRPHQAHLAVRWIEFGNEVSYSYRGFGASSAGTYARRAKAAADAIRAANPQVNLAVEALVSNYPNWIRDMKAAVPDLDTRIGGWINHPYGPSSRYSSLLNGSASAIRNAGWRLDASKPFVISEDGIATHDGRTLTDNYGWPKNMTFADAGRAIEAKVSDVTARWPVGVYLVYQDRDQRDYADSSTNREHWFGVFRRDGSPKGAYTDAVRRVMAR